MILLSSLASISLKSTRTFIVVLLSIINPLMISFHSSFSTAAWLFFEVA